MRIDAHQHFWRYSPADYAWIDERMDVLKRDFLPSDLRTALSASDLDGCVAVQARQDVEETAWLLQLAEENDFVRGVVGWVDLRAPDVREQLGRLHEHPRLRGVRHVVQDEPDDEFLLGDAVANTLMQPGTEWVSPPGERIDWLADRLRAAHDLVRRWGTLTSVPSAPTR